MISLDEIRITGGRALEGSVVVQGSKNAALPMMAASLLHRGVSVLRGCPKITDVYCMEEILNSLGAVSRWEGKNLYLDCSGADLTEIPAAATGRMRSSVILLGAMLGRSGRGVIGYPGGCVIGKRPVDIHLHVLRRFGAKVDERQSCITAEAGCLRGAEIVFPRRSVGATEQAVLAAVLASGRTVLHNCAREPEIVWLCRYLRGMGARIWRRGERQYLHLRRILPAGRRYYCSGRQDRGGNLSLRGGGHQRKNRAGKPAGRRTGRIP